MSKTTSPRITVSGPVARNITYVVGGMVLVVILAWLWINATTSIVGITIALGPVLWVKAIGLAFPASDVLAISVDMIGRFVVDENDEPVISQDTVRLVWVLWGLAAFLDVALTFYVFDKLNYEQFASGELYSAGLITEANRRWIPAVLALSTYALTVLIIHGSRGIIKSMVERFSGGGGGWSRKASKGFRPTPKPVAPPPPGQSPFRFEPQPQPEPPNPFRVKPNPFNPDPKN